MQHKRVAETEFFSDGKQEVQKETNAKEAMYSVGVVKNIFCLLASTKGNYLVTLEVLCP